MYEIWIQLTNVFKRYRPETIFHSEIKGHNSDNNRCILSVIELDLYFMIIYLCMKYESNSPMYSKDIARKPFFVPRSRAITLIIIVDFTCNQTWPVFYYYIPVYEIWIQLTNVFKRYRPETIFRTYGTGRTGRTYVRTYVRTRVMLYAPPHYKWRGHKKTKCYGRRHARTDVKTVYPPQTKFVATTNKVCGGYNKSLVRWDIMPSSTNWTAKEKRYGHLGFFVFFVCNLK